MSTTDCSASSQSADVHAAYIRKESFIAALINSAFSALFVFIVFGAREDIPLWGRDGIALDFIPQTLIIGLMTVIAATLVTRKRVRAGSVPPRSDTANRLPSNALLRALFVATIGTVVFGGVATALLSAVWSGPYSFRVVLISKILYGALVAAIVAGVALNAALGERQ